MANTLAAPTNQVEAEAYWRIFQEHFKLNVMDPILEDLAPITGVAKYTMMKERLDLDDNFVQGVLTAAQILASMDHCGYKIDDREAYKDEYIIISAHIQDDSVLSVSIETGPETKKFINGNVVNL